MVPLLSPCSQSLYLQEVLGHHSFCPSQFPPWVQESVPELKQAREIWAIDGVQTA